MRRRLSVVLAIAFAGLIVSGIGQAQGTPPVISSGPDLWTQETTATFVFSGDSDDTFQCRLEGPDPQDWQNCTSDSSQSYAGLHEGQYTFTVRAASNLAESLPVH